MLNVSRILVPVDFSAESDLALNWAIRLAQEESSPLIVLCHVLPRITPVGPEAMSLPSVEYVRAERKAIEKKLHSLQMRIPSGVSSSWVIKTGPTAYEIVQVCQEKSADLAIMTTHGRRGLSHMLQGSTSEEVVRLAPCPVLVLHLNAAAASAISSDSTPPKEECL